MLSEAERRDRSLGPTGSTVAAMLNLNRYSSPLAAWLEATGKPVASNDEALRLGHVLEPVAIGEYQHKTGRSVQHQPHRYSVTIDGVKVSAAADGLARDGVAEIGVEAKSHVLGAADDYGAEGTDEIPTHEWVQCQIGMLVSGLRRWDLVLFCDNRARIYVVPYDGVRATDMAKRAVAWWKKYVAGNVRPEPTGSEREHEVIDAVYPGQVWHDKAVLRAATEAEAALVARLKLARAASKKAEAEVEAIVQALKLSIGDGDGIEAPAGSITWRRNRDGRKVDHAAALTAYRNRVGLAVAALLGRHWPSGDEEHDGLMMAVRDAVANVDLASYTTTTTGARPFNTPRDWSK